MPHRSDSTHLGVEEIAARLPSPALQPQAGPGRPAAVMVPLFRQDGEWRLLFIRRSRHVTVHQGQIAFPGGCWEPEDRDCLATALRETREELGLEIDSRQVLGGLTPCPTATTRFLIHPFVAVLPDHWTPRPDPAEVEEVLDWPLRQFLAGGEGEPVTFPLPGQDPIWGATARILAELVTLLRAKDP